MISSAPNSNAMFVLNTLDNLAAPAALSSIRPPATASQPPHALEQMREAAAQAYAQKAGEMERRLDRTEQEWLRLNPQDPGFGTQTVNTNIQLQALNKERLRLPMELQALKVETYAQLHRMERNLKLLMIGTVPLLLCLIGGVLFLRQRRRRSLPPASFH